MRRIAILLCDSDNPYERALAEAGQEAARGRGVELLTAQFAASSSVAQLSNLFTFQRSGVDGYVFLAVDPDLLTSATEGLLRSGASVVFLNRPPADLERLQHAYPKVLVAAVMPDQRQVGQVQGEQCLRLAPKGGMVLLVTGTAETSSASMRRAGFLDRVRPPAYEVHELDGRWNVSAAEEALDRWFRVGAARRKGLDAVVCQNDAMALGVRAALVREASRAGRPELATVPVTGVDGLPDDGQRRVRDGSLSATVVMPLTSGPAVHALCDFWNAGERAGRLVLPASPYPPAG